MRRACYLWRMLQFYIISSLINLKEEEFFKIDLTLAISVVYKFGLLWIYKSFRFPWEGVSIFHLSLSTSDKIYLNTIYIKINNNLVSILYIDIFW